jgi:hypothetical protein
MKKVSDSEFLHVSDTENDSSNMSDSEHEL